MGGRGGRGEGRDGADGGIFYGGPFAVVDRKSGSQARCVTVGTISLSEWAVREKGDRRNVRRAPWTGGEYSGRFRSNARDCRSGAGGPTPGGCLIFFLWSCQLFGMSLERGGTGGDVAWQSGRGGKFGRLSADGRHGILGAARLRSWGRRKPNRSHRKGRRRAVVTPRWHFW